MSDNTSAELAYTETAPDGIEYRVYIEPGDLSVYGEALGDAHIKAQFDEIVEELEGGNTWALARVTVEAAYKGFTGGCGLSQSQYSGGLAEFIGDSSWPYTKAEARAQLVRRLRCACTTLEEASYRQNPALPGSTDYRLRLILKAITECVPKTWQEALWSLVPISTIGFFLLLLMKLLN